jgi:hypothetical protein
VIWETNMRTSYAAGGMAQLVEGDFAFWIYRHGGSREPRPQHLAWDGLTLPPDHPFWTTHAPPNGWGCSCSVTGSRSRRIARRMGGDPDMTLPEGWDRPDPRTGAPPGIDRGWAHAPGASVAETVRTMAEKAVNWDYSLSVAYMRDLPPAHVDAFARAYRALPSLATELRRWSERVIGVRNGGPIDPKVTVVPQKSLGLATVAQVAQIERLTGLTVKGQLLDLAIDRDAVRHVMARHTDPETERSRGQRPVLPTDFGKLGELVNGPDRMVLGPRIPRRGPVVRYEKIFGAERYVALFEVRTGRRRLSLVTMRVEKGAGASPTAPP